ncbi:MAG: YgfZ/GcvT domain-containing protein [Pseudomonadota bacterium]
MKPAWTSFLTDVGAEFTDGKLTHFGNPERERRMVLAGPVLADLDHLGLLEVRGPDARSFLQAQLATDVGKVSVEQASFACYLNPQGKVIASFILFMRGEDFYLMLPREQLEDMLARLRRFVLRARVTLEDASETLIRIGISGTALAGDLQDCIGGALPIQPFAVLTVQDTTLVALPGPARWLALAPLAEMKDLWQRLQVHGAPVGPEAWALLAIQAGEPFLSAETAEQFIPQMLNLDALGAIGFGKGCYPGQETVTRVRHRGEIKRRLRIGLAQADTAPRSGMSLIRAGETAEEAAGTVIAAARHPDGGYLTLAVVRQDVLGAGDITLPDCGNAVFRPRELPYPLPER